jgi:hypothetical protein
MSEVYDLDAVAAEIVREPFRFRYGGREWEFAHMADVDWRVISAADTGDMDAVKSAFRVALGDQVKEFDKLPQPISVMNDLFGRWMAHSGLNEGESPASPVSSGSTAGPSNRASRRATKSTPAKSLRAN